MKAILRLSSRSSLSDKDKKKKKKEKRKTLRFGGTSGDSTKSVPVTTPKERKSRVNFTRKDSSPSKVSPPKSKINDKESIKEIPLSAEVIPPPPPMELVNNVETIDAEFVDFTIVPLLLRSQMSYEHANSFGEHMKHFFSRMDAANMLKNPKQFFSALHKAGWINHDYTIVKGVSDPEAFRLAIESDAIWSQKGSEGQRSKSFVYYRPSSQKSFSESDDEKEKKQKRRQTQRYYKAERKSFMQQKVPTHLDQDYHDPNFNLESAANAIRALRRNPL